MLPFNTANMFLAANIHFEGVIEYFFQANCCTRQTENAFGGKYPLTIIDVLHDVDKETRRPGLIKG